MPSRKQRASAVTESSGPQPGAALSEGVVPHPRSTAGYVIEVDLEDDLVMFVNNGKLEYTLNTSTGGGYQYSDGSGGTDIATTPTGLFHTYREVDGLVVDYLGQLWMPKFFTGGFAIHGDSYVPPEPVSHGCVRVSDEAIEWIWASQSRSHRDDGLGLLIAQKSFELFATELGLSWTEGPCPGDAASRLASLVLSSQRPRVDRQN